MRVLKCSQGEPVHDQLTLQACAWARRGDVALAGPVLEYRVLGMPIQQKALIASFGGRYGYRWKLLRVKDGVSGDWTGNHDTPEQALAQL